MNRSKDTHDDASTVRRIDVRHRQVHFHTESFDQPIVCHEWNVLVLFADISVGILLEVVVHEDIVAHVPIDRRLEGFRRSIRHRNQVVVHFLLHTIGIPEDDGFDPCSREWRREGEMNSLLHARPFDSVVECIRFSQHGFGLLDHSRLIEHVAIEELVHVG